MNAQNAKDIVHKALENSKILLPDLKTYQYMRTEGYSELRRHSLGGGNLSMLLVEMSILGFISKLYYVLIKGSDSYVSKAKIAEYNALLGGLGGSSITLKQYLYKPRLGDINETKAIGNLLYSYPVDIGLPKNKEVISQVWRGFRNRLVHMSQLEPNNIAMTIEMPPVNTPNGVIIQNYKDGEWFSDEAYKSFHLEQDLELRKKLVENSPESELTKLIYQSTSDQVYVDRLLGDIEHIFTWMHNQVDEADEVDIQNVVDWLDIENIV